MRNKSSTSVMDPKIKKELIKVRNAVKRKLQALKEGALQEEDILRKSYRPLVEPLVKLKEEIRLSQPKIKKEIKNEVENVEQSFKEPTSFIPLSRSNISAEAADLSTMLPTTDEEEDRILDYTKQQIQEIVADPNFQDKLDDYEPLPRYYIEGILSDTEGDYNNQNDVRYDFLQNKLYAGDEEMRVIGKDLEIMGRKFTGTPGLYELLFKKHPTGFKQKDMENYKEIMELVRPDNPQTYITSLNHDTKGVFDTQYGVRFNPEREKYFIGDSEIKFGTNKITVKNMRYTLSRGLLELLFKKDPTGYKEADLAKYKDIVYRTNAHKIGYKSTAPIAGNKGKKYQLIKKLMTGPLFPSSAATSTPIRNPSGRGLWMDFNEKPIEYVYFDDVNELCERLKLLISSQTAGNTNHTNEIASIIEELRECGIIE